MRKLLLALLLVCAPAWAQTGNPLLASTDITFVGKFAISNSDPGGTCNTFNYGSYGLSYWKDGSNRKTLFLAGNDQAFSCMGQVQVPSDANLRSAATAWGSLTVATTLQSLHDIASTFSGFDPGNGNPDWMMGSLVVGGRLILCGSNSYSFDQTKSCGVWDSPSNLAATVASNFHGFFDSTASAQPRSLGGYILAIPAEWQSIFGGDIMVGNCCISIISTTSFGPALTVVTASGITTGTYAGTTVLEYPGPGANTICRTTNCEAGQNVYFNLTTRVLGGAIIPGTRTVLFVSGHGTGPYCYGTAAECGNDDVMSDVKGPHAQPYRYQILAYDLNDIKRVKDGLDQRWTPLPYNKLTPWVLPELSGTGNGEDPRGHGVAFDPETGRMYVTAVYGNQPTVYVYQVTAPASATTYLPFRS